jgi:hypothetical protein
VHIKISKTASQAEKLFYLKGSKANRGKEKNKRQQASQTCLITPTRAGGARTSPDALLLVIIATTTGTGQVLLHVLAGARNREPHNLR